MKTLNSKLAVERVCMDAVQRIFIPLPSQVLKICLVFYSISAHYSRRRDHPVGSPSNVIYS